MPVYWLLFLFVWPDTQQRQFKEELVYFGWHLRVYYIMVGKLEQKDKTAGHLVSLGRDASTPAQGL